MTPKRTRRSPILAPILTALAVAAGLALASCGASGPTPELVDARRAYDNARMSQARKLAPDKLLEARDALAEAEQAHQSHPGSISERHHAYLAIRRAQLAMAYADVEAARREAEAAQTEYQRELEKKALQGAAERDERQRVERDLAAVRKDLAAKGDQLDESTQELRRREAELAARSDELDQERAAREQAESERDAALKSLEEFANVREDQRGLVITLSGAVLFKTDEAVLLPIARERLDQVADALQFAEDEQTFVVEGHTDSRGSQQYNRELSQRRAEAVRAYLVTRGCPPDRIIAVGKGEDEPIAANESAEGRANNRRVEIVISKQPAAIHSAR